MEQIIAKLVKLGNSIYVLIPRKCIDKLELSLGDNIYIFISKDKPKVFK